VSGASSLWADENFFTDPSDLEEYGAFFDGDSGSHASCAPTSEVFAGGQPASEAIRVKEEVGTEAGCDSLSPNRGGKGLDRAELSALEPNGPVSFVMDDDDIGTDDDMEQSEYTLDCRAPEVPEPLGDFTAEDMRLREAILDFYYCHSMEKLSNVNFLVKRYRGRAASHLWAQLAIKYKVPANEAVELMAKTLYVTSAFEYIDEQEAEALDQLLAGSQLLVGGTIDSAECRTTLLHKTVGTCTFAGSDRVMRALCFRGIPEGSRDLRGKVWGALLGYFPASRPSEWMAIREEMRMLYASCKAEILPASGGQVFDAKAEGRNSMKVAQLLAQIKQDVSRLEQRDDHACKPSNRNALTALQLVHAHLNSDMEYVQGTSEIAAVAFHVMSVDQGFEEADTFWCFTYLMRELRSGFLQSLQSSAESPPAMVVTLERLTKLYDPRLARHLHKNNSLASVFTSRWCTLLFAQDMPLADIVRLWDCLLADPQRFELMPYVSLAVLLSCREELLDASDVDTLGVVLRRAPRQIHIDDLLKKSWALCAFERRVQNPSFPGAAKERVAQELSGWAQSAAAKAQEIGVGVAQSVQQTITPARTERMGQALGSAASVAHGSVEAVKSRIARSVEQNITPASKEHVGQALGSAAALAQGSVGAVAAWLAQDAPIQPETCAAAQTKFVSLWKTVRTSGAAVVTEGQRLATDGQVERVENTASVLSSAADVAASAPSAMFTHIVPGSPKPSSEEQVQNSAAS